MTMPNRADDQPAEPEVDDDGYPTDATLDRVKSWPCTSMQACLEAMDYVGRAWYYPDYWDRKDGMPADYLPNYTETRYTFSTGGWSGNESLVGAIEENFRLQAMGAYSWRRGGHYEYRFQLVREITERGELMDETD